MGSLPGTDPLEAARLVLGEVPDLPYLPELPARGPGADLIGRSAALLVDIAVEWQPHGWTVTSGRGRDYGRARDLMSWDLDAVTELGQGVELLKVQVCGPLTLAAGIELPNLYKLLTDQGALRDLTASLAEGVRAHLAELADRLPGTRFVLQVDEPALPAVLAGRVPTPSGYGTVAALERSVAEPLLAEVLSVVPAGSAVVHCCAADVPFDLLRAAGAAAVAFDDSFIGVPQLDAIGEYIEAGGSLWVGLVPGAPSGSLDNALLSTNRLRGKLFEVWGKLGFANELLASTVVPTPRCGMAGASEPYVRAVMKSLTEVGRSLLDEPE
jgi:hypothetical protein